MFWSADTRKKKNSWFETYKSTTGNLTFGFQLTY